jgi:hypothetical protein
VRVAGVASTAVVLQAGRGAVVSKYRHFLHFDCEADASPVFDNEHESVNTTPFNVWHGRAVRWALPGELKASAQRELLADLKDAFDRLRAGTEIVWDGNNHVGQRDDDADDARDEVEAYIAGLHESALVRVWDAADWFGPCRDNELGVAGDMTDDEVAALAERLEAEALESGECDEIEGGTRYLLGRRDSAREKLEAQGWEPTHELRFEGLDGAVLVDRVMLVEEEDEPSAAYTAVEWCDEAGACWSRRSDGTWWWRDQATPGGASGTVTVRDL